MSVPPVVSPSYAPQWGPAVRPGETVSVILLTIYWVLPQWNPAVKPG
ncbi:hypothetical protein [Acrocarpospora pleiomorpha]